MVPAPQGVPDGDCGAAAVADSGGGDLPRTAEHLRAPADGHGSTLGFRP